MERRAERPPPNPRRNKEIDGSGTVVFSDHPTATFLQKQIIVASRQN